jgi:hypothetical protein
LAAGVHSTVDLVNALEQYRLGEQANRRTGEQAYGQDMLDLARLDHQAGRQQARVRYQPEIAHELVRWRDPGWRRSAGSGDASST